MLTYCLDAQILLSLHLFTLNINLSPLAYKQSRQDNVSPRMSPRRLCIFVVAMRMSQHTRSERQQNVLVHPMQVQAFAHLPRSRRTKEPKFSRCAMKAVVETVECRPRTSKIFGRVPEVPKFLQELAPRKTCTWHRMSLLIPHWSWLADRSQACS